uniref:Uncharacterized protein n=1 Tax=Plectus sambesii TaxID=2011161 RepID=A0A914W1Y7_9BILA
MLANHHFERSQLLNPRKIKAYYSAMKSQEQQKQHIDEPIDEEEDNLSQSASGQLVSGQSAGAHSLRSSAFHMMESVKDPATGHQYVKRFSTRHLMRVRVNGLTMAHWLETGRVMGENVSSRL